jgi:DNA-binding HxlR family transcriptional regulator
MDTKASPAWNVYDERCPTRMVLGRLADKWTVLVVGQLAHSTRRFGELRREIMGILPKVLTQALRSLERDGLITRRVYANVPPKVEYTLTPLGRTLISLVDGIREWAETHIEAVLEAQQTFDQQTQDVSEPVL